MIGLPYQTIENLADDIIFMKDLDIDMCGMGPYIEHRDTPLFHRMESLFIPEERYQLSLKMIAVLRIVMKDINIASTTAMQTINSEGKKTALQVGANVIMPNITPIYAKSSYHLYENKPGSDLNVSDEFMFCLQEIINSGGNTAFNEPGDALHYLNK